MAKTCSWKWNWECMQDKDLGHSETCKQCMMERTTLTKGQWLCNKNYEHAWARITQHTTSLMKNRGASNMCNQSCDTTKQNIGLMTITIADTIQLDKRMFGQSNGGQHEVLSSFVQWMFVMQWACGHVQLREILTHTSLFLWNWLLTCLKTIFQSPSSNCHHLWRLEIKGKCPDMRNFGAQSIEESGTMQMTLWRKQRWVT